MSDLTFRDGISGGVGLAAGVVLGFLASQVLRRIRGGAIHTYDTDDEDDTGSSNAYSGFSNEEHKLVLCVRTDLKMQKGKIAAQVGHATLGAYKKAARRNPAALRHWEINAQPKIALQVRSYHEAQMLEKRASRLGIPTFMVHDAGRTQIAAVSCFHHLRQNDVT